MQHTLGARMNRKFLTRSSGGCRPQQSLRAAKACAVSKQRSAVVVQEAQQTQAPSQEPAYMFLARGALQQMQGAALPSAGLVAAMAVLCWVASPDLAHADPQHHGPLFDLAEDEDFLANVVRYGRYFVTVMLGTGYVMVKPLLNAFKRPVSAVLAIVAIVGLTLGIKVTLEAMLGVTEYAYQLGEDVPMAPSPYI